VASIDRTAYPRFKRSICGWVFTPPTGRPVDTSTDCITNGNDFSGPAALATPGCPICCGVSHHSCSGLSRLETDFKPTNNY
jgi:hypothetical protein